MKLDGLRLENPLFLGPMAGITDKTYRGIVSELGCDATVTEMVSAKGLHYGDPKTELLLGIGPLEKTAGIQIFGSDPEIMAEAAERLGSRPNVFLDINMGCPVPKVVKNGEGSALMKRPDLAFEIVKRVCERAGKPVTVKMRIGWDGETVNAPSFARRMELAGAAAVTVHGRTRDQFYGGEADWKTIRQVKEAVGIPVVLSGDVVDGPSAEKALEATGCDGLMIARAAKGNPWIFREIKHYLRTGMELEKPGPQERVAMARKHLAKSLEDKTPYIAAREFRKHCAWYLKGLPHAASIRDRVNRTETPEALMALLDSLLE